MHVILIVLEPVIKVLFVKLPCPIGIERNFFELRVKLSLVHHTRWRLHTVLFIAKRQEGSKTNLDLVATRSDLFFLSQF